MAKRSYIQSIRSKQSSAYKGTTRTPSAIHALTEPRKSGLAGFPKSMTPSEMMMDAQAEKAMNPHRYSKKRNPVCPVCHIQIANNGDCSCN